MKIGDGALKHTEKTLEYSQLLQWHGLADLFASQTKLQALTWGIIIGIAFAGLTYEVQNVISEYLDQPYVIVTNPIYLESQRVPDTVVCSTAPLNTRKLRNANFTEGEIAQIHMVFTPDWYTVPNGWFVKEETRYDINGKVRGMGLTWEQFLMDFGMDCKDVLDHCMMNWAIRDCCNIVTPVLHRYFGKCFAFQNLDQIKNQTLSFLFGGLVVVAKNPQLQQKKDLYGMFLRGLAVEIAHRYIGQNTYEILPVAPSEVTEISLTAEKNVRQPDRPGGCIQRKNWNSRMTPHFCWNKGVIEICNCSLAGYYKHKEVPLCFPEQYVPNCVHADLQRVYDECVKELALPSCTEWLYKPTILRTLLDFNDSNFYTRAISGFEKPPHLKKLDPNTTYSMINVYFSRMGYTETKEVSTYTIHRFVSSIGGHLSLFLGASLISLVQLIVYLPGICLRASQKK